MKKTVIDQIEITSTGMIQIRMRKLIIEDDGTSYDIGFHRATIEPGTDIDKQISDINSNLRIMKMGDVDASKIPLLKEIIKLVHTPEIIAEYKKTKGENGI